MEDPNKLQLSLLEELTPVIQEIISAQCIKAIETKMSSIMVVDAKQWIPSVLSLLQDELNEILSKQQNKKLPNLARTNLYFESLLLLMAFLQEKDHFDLPLTCQARNTFTKPIFKSAAQTELKIVAAYTLFEFCIQHQLLSKDYVERMFNHQSSVVMISAVLAAKPPTTDKSNDQTRIKLWDIIQIKAEQLRKQNNIFIDSFDIRIICQEMAVEQYLNQKLVQNACKQLKPNTLQYQCFQLFNPEQKKINTNTNEIYTKNYKNIQLLTNISRLPIGVIKEIEKISGTKEKPLNISKLFLINKQLLQLRTSPIYWNKVPKPKSISDEIVDQIERHVTEFCPNINFPLQSIYKMYRQYCLNTPLENLEHAWQWICLSNNSLLIQTAITQGIITKDSTDSNNRTPLHFFALTGNVPCLKQFIDDGFDKDSVDVNGSGLLQYAGLGSQKEIFDYLINTELKKELAIPFDISDKNVLITNVIRYVKKGSYIACLNAYGIALCHSMSTIHAHGRTEMMIVAKHYDEAAQLKYINLRSNTLNITAGIKDKMGDSEEHYVYMYCSSKVIEKYIEYRGQSLLDTALMVNDQNQTPLYALFHYNKNKSQAQLAYLNVRKEDVVRSADIKDSIGNTEFHDLLLTCDDQVVLQYMEYRGESLMDTAAMKSCSGRTEGARVIPGSKRSEDVAIAYIKLRGSHLFETSWCEDNYFKYEEELFLNCEKEKVVEAYISARGKTLNDTAINPYHSGINQGITVLKKNTAKLINLYLTTRDKDIWKTSHLQDNQRNTEGMIIFGDKNQTDDEQLMQENRLLYIKNRGETFNKTKNLYNKAGLNELITCFIHSDEQVQCALIAAYGKHIADTVLQTDQKSQWYEGTWAFALLKPEIFNHYLKQIPDQEFKEKAKQKLQQQALSKQYNFVNTMLNADISLVAKTKISINLGMFQTIDFKHIESVSSEKFYRALLIGAKIDSNYHVFFHVITSINEFINHILTLKMPEVWQRYGYLTERLPLLKHYYSGSLSTYDLNVIDKLLEIVDWYNPSHNHTEPRNFNYPWMSFYHFANIKNEPELQALFIEECGQDIQRKSVMTEGDDSELLYVISYCQRPIQARYLDARSKSVCDTALDKNSKQETESLRVIENANLSLLNSYFKRRGTHLAETCDETIRLYCKHNQYTIKDYIDARAEHYTENEINDLPENFWYEKAIAFVSFNNELFSYYINTMFDLNCQAEMRKRIMKYAFTHSDKVVNKILSDNSVMSSWDGLLLFASVVRKLGMFTSITICYKILYSLANSFELKNDFLINLTVNNKPVTNNTIGFYTPITTLKDFQSEVEKLQPSQVWDRYHHLIEYLSIIQEIKDQENDVASVNLINQILNIIVQYDPEKQNDSTQGTVVKPKFQSVFFQYNTEDILLKLVSRYPHQMTKDDMKYFVTLLQNNPQLIMDNHEKQLKQLETDKHFLYCAARHHNLQVLQPLIDCYVKCYENMNSEKVKLIFNSIISSKKELIEFDVIKHMPILFENLNGFGSAFSILFENGDFFTIKHLLSKIIDVASLRGYKTDLTKYSTKLADNYLKHCDELTKSFTHQCAAVEKEIVSDDLPPVVLDAIKVDLKSKISGPLREGFNKHKIDINHVIKTQCQHQHDYGQLYQLMSKHCEDLKLAYQQQTQQAWLDATESYQNMLIYLRQSASLIDLKYFIISSQTKLSSTLLYIFYLSQSTLTDEDLIVFEKEYSRMLNPDNSHERLNCIKSPEHLQSMLKKQFIFEIHTKCQQARLEVFNQVFDIKQTNVANSLI